MKATDELIAKEETQSQPRATGRIPQAASGNLNNGPQGRRRTVPLLPPPDPFATRGKGKTEISATPTAAPDPIATTRSDPYATTQVKVSEGSSGAGATETAIPAASELVISFERDEGEDPTRLLPPPNPTADLDAAGK